MREIITKLETMLADYEAARDSAAAVLARQKEMREERISYVTKEWDDAVSAAAKAHDLACGTVARCNRALAVIRALPAVEEPTGETPTFVVWDEVEFAVSATDLPVWNFASNEREPHRTIRGAVHSIDTKRNILTTRHDKAGGRLQEWHWPLPGHYQYSPEQWSRPGYLRHAQKEEEK